MRKLNVNLEPVKEFAGKTLEVVGIGLVTFASLWCAAKADEFNSTKTVYVAGYSDAVDAIMKSKMSSYYKQEAVKKLKRDGDIEYYKAVSYIVNSQDMSSYYMVEAIEGLGK